MVGVFLLWEDLVEDLGVGYLLKSVGRDVMVFNEEEGIRSLDTFSRALRVLSYCLAEAVHLIGVGRGPGGGILGMFAEFFILHEMARIFIEYWKFHGIGACCVCPGAVRNGRFWRLCGWWRRGEDGV